MLDSEKIKFQPDLNIFGKCKIWYENLAQKVKLRKFWVWILTEIYENYMQIICKLHQKSDNFDEMLNLRLTKSGQETKFTNFAFFY